MERTLYTDEDQTIIQTARELCRRLNITRFNPQTVSWVAVRANRSRNGIASDDCGFDRTRVFMPSSLRGKLGPDELRSVITPRLIFQTNIGIRLRYYLASLFFGPYIVGMTALGTFLGFRVLNLQRGTLAAVIFSVMFLSIFFLFFLFVGNRSALYSRKLWLASDNRAAKLVGKQDLLHVLEKIDSMKLEDIEVQKMRKLSTWTVRARPSHPSINERIANLASNSS